MNPFGQDFAKWRVVPNSQAEIPHPSGHTPFVSNGASYDSTAGARNEEDSDNHAARVFAQGREPILVAQAGRVPLALQRAANAEFQRLGIDTSRIRLIFAGRSDYVAETDMKHQPTISVKVPERQVAMTYVRNGTYRTHFFRDMGGKLELLREGLLHWTKTHAVRCDVVTGPLYQTPTWP